MDKRSDSPESYCNQHTLKNWTGTQGVGLHSGKSIEFQLGPAPEDTGIVFERADLPGRPIVKCCPRSIRESELCTTLETNGVRVSTVEHLLAVLLGMGVDNCRVVLSGAEVPILDGSATPFVQLINDAGIRRQDRLRSLWCLRRSVSVRDGDRLIAVRPAHRLQIDCRLDYDHPLVSDQRHLYIHDAVGFQNEIAPARMFGFLKDVETLQRAGLARGGSLDNAIVIDSFSILNPGGLRFPDEFVRHKVLDILGDLALLGGVLLGRVVAHKSGHALHRTLVRRLAADASNCVRIRVTPDMHVINPSLDSNPIQPEWQMA
jgi:UDP-3-O-[3-hydroxymyristoyl] N-acetylglucosamine deacetylase